jgi:hypothetical protein
MNHWQVTDVLPCMHMLDTMRGLMSAEALDRLLVQVGAFYY